MKDGEMPKEVIYDSVGLYDTVVRWSDNELQVGIQTHGGIPIAEALGWDKDDSESVALFRSLWGTLDRPAVNRLIRSLRSARDRAFGRDE